MKVEFPSVQLAAEDGLLAVGGNLQVETLINAYTSGIFPWPVDEDYPLTWFAPNPRGIIKTSNIKFSQSLKKFVNKTNFNIKINQDFESIITKCAHAKRKHESGTWIYSNIIQAYTEMFNAKKAYCIGVYNDEALVGGLYGVCIGQLISGESMFYEEANASKLALYTLLNILIEKKIPFIDTQMVTPIIESFGGENISRPDFMDLLSSIDLTLDRESIF